MPTDTAIDFWYGPTIRRPLARTAHRWVTVPGRITSTVGVYDARWELVDRDDLRPRPLTLGPTAYRLVERGDFNIEIEPSELRPGPNPLAIRVVDLAGQTHEAQTNVLMEPTPTHRDDIDIAWSSIQRIDDVAQVVDGRWELTIQGLRTQEIGYDRVVALGDRSWRDYDVCCSFTVHGRSDNPLSYGLPSCGCLVGLILRWDGHVDWHDLVPYRGYKPFGALVVHAHEFGSPRLGKQTRWGVYLNDDRLHPENDRACNAVIGEGQTWWMRAAVRSNVGGPSTYVMKAWPYGSPEPADWLIETIGSEHELSHGSVALLAHQTDVTFHTVRIQNSTLSSTENNG